MIGGGAKTANYILQKLKGMKLRFRVFPTFLIKLIA